jgi:hypothetical protein
MDPRTAAPRSLSGVAARVRSDVWHQQAELEETERVKKLVQKAVTDTNMVETPVMLRNIGECPLCLKDTHEVTLTQGNKDGTVLVQCVELPAVSNTFKNTKGLWTQRRATRNRNDSCSLSRRSTRMPILPRPIFDCSGGNILRNCYAMLGRGKKLGSVRAGWCLLCYWKGSEKRCTTISRMVQVVGQSRIQYGNGIVWLLLAPGCPRNRSRSIGRRRAIVCARRCTFAKVNISVPSMRIRRICHKNPPSGPPLPRLRMILRSKQWWQLRTVTTVAMGQWQRRSV